MNNWPEKRPTCPECGSITSDREWESALSIVYELKCVKCRFVAQGHSIPVCLENLERFRRQHEKPTEVQDALPCPFCGSAAVSSYSQRKYDFCCAVECSNESCGVFVAKPNVNDAVKLWNTRR